MDERTVQYCLRLPRELYHDAADVAHVFHLSLNRLLVEAIRGFVASQLQQDATGGAIERIREARHAGLVEAGPVPGPARPVDSSGL
jgi:hypothetical protein